MFSRKNNWVDRSVSCLWTHSPELVFVQAARSGNQLHRFRAAELTAEKADDRQGKNQTCCKRNISVGCTPEITCQFLEAYSF